MLKKKVIFSVSASLVSLFVTLLSISYLTSITKVGQFAIISVVLVINGFLGVFDVYRVPAINLILRRPRLRTQIINSVFWLSAKTSLFSGTSFSLIMAFFYGFALETFIVFFSALFFVMSPFFWIIIDSKNNVVVTAWCRAIAQSSLYISLIVLHEYELNYFWAILISASTLLVLLFMCTPDKKNIFHVVILPPKKKLSLHILRNSISIFYHYVSSTLLANFERFICYFIGGPVLFAIATAFTEFSNRATFFSRLLNIAIFPSLSKWVAESKMKKCIHLLYKIDLVYLVFFIASLTIVYGFADHIIILVFNENFAQQKLLFILCIFSGCFRVFTYQSIIRFNLLGDFFTQSIFSTMSAVLAALCLLTSYFYPASLVLMVLIVKAPEFVMFIVSIKKFQYAKL